MLTISDEQIAEIEANTGETAVLPCEQQETTTLSASPLPIPDTPQIVNYSWLSIIKSGETESTRIIKSTPTDRKVKIQLTTQGIADGEKITMSIINKDGTVVTSLDVSIKDNNGTSAEFNITKEMSNYQLLANVESYNYEGSNLLSVYNIIVEELQIQLIDCRSNEKIAKSRVKKIIINNGQEFTKEFALKEDKNKITTTGIQGLADALVKLGYGKAEIDSKTKTAKPVTILDKTWTDNYNNYWQDRIADFEDLLLGEEPATTMINYVIGEYNNHLQADENGVLKVQIPFKSSDTLGDERKECTVQVEFFDFPTVCEGIGTQQLERFNKNASVEDGTGFSVEWTGIQNTGWLEGFGWKLVRGTSESELKVSEEVKAYYNNASGFTTSPEDIEVVSEDEDQNADPLFTLFALQWCQPVWDEIEDPDPTEGLRSNDYTFINMKDGGKWIKGLHMHIPSKHSGSSGPYYGIFDTISPYPRGNKHEGVDLYSGPNGDNSAFAIHGGKITTHAGSGYGYRAYLLFGEIGTPAFHYAHLREAATAKDWVKAGTIIGTSGLTRKFDPDGSTTMVTFNNEPYHLHLEFIKSITSTSGAIGGTKSVFSDIRTISPSEDAGYSTPLGANAFLFQGNKLPLVLPCKSVYCSGGVNGSDTTSIKDCKLNGENYKTCYAMQRYPYENNLLLAGITDMVSENIKPSTGIIRFICPHILSTEANKKAQLQAKLKFIFTNKNRFEESIFPHNNQSTFDGFLTGTISIDGNLGTGSINAIKSLVKAHYYCVNNDKEENDRILTNNNSSIDSAKIQAFINKYVDDTVIPDSDEYKIIKDFYTWFNEFNFNLITHANA